MGELSVKAAPNGAEAAQPLSKTHVLKALLTALHRLDGAAVAGQSLFNDQKNGSSQISDQLCELRKQAAIVTESIRDTLLAVETANDPVESLLNMRDADWNFNTDAVRAYRAKRAQARHKLVSGPHWAQPQYSSSSPLATHPPMLSCKVFVPGSKAPVQVKFSKDYTVQDLVSASCPPGLASADHVLKVVGRDEYLTSLDSAVMGHACVREAVRARKPMRLRLVQRAPAVVKTPVDVQGAVDLAANYIASAAAAAPPQTAAPQAEEFLPLSQVTVPMRCQVQGIEGVTLDSLPRFDHTISHVFVRMWLIHGSTLLAGGTKTSVTASVPLSAAPRWSQWLHSADIKLSQLPRETRVCFTLHGERTSALAQQLGKSEILAWVCQQLFDSEGRMMQGSQDLGLWALPPRSKDEERRLQKQQQQQSGGQRGKSSAVHAAMEAKGEDGYLWTLIRGPSNQNMSLQQPKALLTVKMAKFVLPVIASEQATVSIPSLPAVVSDISQLDPIVQARVNDLLGKDALYTLTDADRRLLWLTRQCLTSYPHMLPFVLQSADWKDPAQRLEVHRLLQEWAPLTQVSDMLALLNAHFADTAVREMAVRQLADLPSDQLRSCLLQLTQALKFESFHDSALARLLMRRAKAEPTQVAHHLFWHLKSSLHEPHCVERFSLLLEELLSFCGTPASVAVAPPADNQNQTHQVHFAGGVAATSDDFIDNLRPHRHHVRYDDHDDDDDDDDGEERKLQEGPVPRPPKGPKPRPKMGATQAAELAKQSLVVSQLQLVAEMIAARRTAGGISDSALKQVLHSELEQLNRSLFSRVGSFQIPLDPRLRATTLVVNKCRFMSSKKVPLWLVFNNADPRGDTIYIIFKSGDDLRQDMLTLQLLSEMDRIWLAGGLDLRMNPYKVIATGTNEEGEGVGMIEVVRDSDTTANIQYEFGGGAKGALSLKPLLQYLEHHNPDSKSMLRAKDNFIRSCAGYCVATFVLGIGDRHNGNIMVTKDGHLFHIDFGHFLGNFKTFKGVYNRERAAFVFTPEMAYAIGGADYQNTSEYRRFLSCCEDAFNALRQNVSRLETMFDLMVAAAMPELSSTADIGYLRDRLCLSLTEKEANAVFQKELKRSVNAISRRFDNLFHIKKHNKKK